MAIVDSSKSEVVWRVQQIMQFKIEAAVIYCVAAFSYGPYQGVRPVQEIVCLHANPRRDVLRAHNLALATSL